MMKSIQPNKTTDAICCDCGKRIQAINIIALNQKAPVPGTGWGCVVCDLEPDGAIATLCNDCLKFDDNNDFRIDNIKYAYSGYIEESRLVPVETLTGNHEHITSVHRQFDDNEYLQRLNYERKYER